MKTFLSVLMAVMLSPGVFSQTPVLNSYPTAPATVFLDFDGHYVTGSSWNWSGPINALPSGLSAAAITEIFNRVSEDFRIFNINITTDSTVYRTAGPGKRVRVIITPTWDWYGRAAGAAFVKSYSWGDDTHAWVFSSLLNNNVKNIAEAIAHETGHTMGLQHQSTWNADCGLATEYAKGKGSGEIAWAPIMGVSYAQNLSTWHNGTSIEGCDSYQDDVAIIGSNHFGFRSDDHANTLASASPLQKAGIDFLATGLINSSDDKDVFTFTIPHAAHFRINAQPQSIGAGNAGANLDIKVSLLNQQGDTIGRYNPATLLNAGLDSNLNNGTYYLVVDGVGNVNLADYASLGFYAITGSLGIVLPIHRFTLTGKNKQDQHQLTWTFEADEPVKQVEVQYSTDGKNFTSLVPLPPNNSHFSWKPLESGQLFYRARVITVADERAYYSNIINLKQAGDQSYKLQHTIVRNEINITTGKVYAYQLIDETGRLLQQGKLTVGFNQLDVRSTQRGMLFLRLQAGNEAWTEKLIKQ